MKANNNHFISDTGQSEADEGSKSHLTPSDNFSGGPESKDPIANEKVKASPKSTGNLKPAFQRYSVPKVLIISLDVSAVVRLVSAVDSG